MVLPRKKSRMLIVDETKYRWLVSVHHGQLNLTVESNDDPGQILQAFFEPHDRFKRQTDGKWSFHRQGRSITPDVVTQIVHHGLANGWKPFSKGQKPIEIHAWDTDAIVPASINAEGDGVAIKDLAIDQVGDLRFDLSLDPHWRKILFNASQFQRFPLPDNYCALSDRVRECKLRFAVFNAGWTECGFVVFGIESVDFPDVVMYTTNNPTIV